jgi:hypothetical protein
MERETVGRPSACSESGCVGFWNRDCLLVKVKREWNGAFQASDGSHYLHSSALFFSSKLSYLVGSKFSYAYVHMMMNDLPYFQVTQLKVISVKTLLAQTCLAAGL